MKFVAPGTEIPRDDWGRPLVVPIDGGDPVPYTRCTTYVGAIEDTYKLGRWQQRMVAVGLADRRDLQLAVAAHREDTQRLDAICENAIEAARGRSAATMGTALHAITETHDRGDPVGVLPDEAQRDLDAYIAATTELKPIHIEQFCVLDLLKIGGTPDRIVRYSDGKRYVADLKTGKLDYGYMKIAAQLAVYARSRPYDAATGKRLDPHGAETDRGIVIHLPAGEGVCTLWWIDLLQGWEVVRLCRGVRDKRDVPKRAVLSKIGGPNGVPLPTREPSLAELIVASKTPDAVRELWRRHTSDWNDELTQLAKDHIAELAEQGARP